MARVELANTGVGWGCGACIARPKIASFGSTFPAIFHAPGGLRAVAQGDMAGSSQALKHPPSTVVRGYFAPANGWKSSHPAAGDMAGPTKSRSQLSNQLETSLSKGRTRALTPNKGDI